MVYVLLEDVEGCEAFGFDETVILAIVEDELRGRPVGSEFRRVPPITY